MFGWTECVARRAAQRAAVLLMGLLAATVAQAETRTLKLYHVHLKEKSEITYKRDGKFLPDGLKKANWALRDWRENKPTNMDPKLLDLLYEAHKQSGSRGYIHVIGGYRSPGTNKMLRSRSSGVAGSSLHMSGKAVDFFLPDVPLKKVRDIGLRMQLGGVGYYPRSGSPFVHFDTGKGRYWPRMSRSELAAIFPRGNTIHLPADGKPLAGYETALASYNKRKGANDVQIASSSRSGGGRSLLAVLFGGGADEAEDEAEATAAPVGRTPAPARAAPEPAVQVAAVRPAPALPPATLPNGVAMPDRDAFDGSSPARAAPPAGIPAVEAAAAETAVAALVPARVPLPTRAPARPDAIDPAETLVAALEAEAAPGAPAQLAYAVPTPRARPPFEAVLRGEQAALPTPRMVGAEPELTPESIIAAAMAESAAAAAGSTAAHAVATPSHRPAEAPVIAALMPAAAQPADPIRLAALSAPAPAPARTLPASRPTVSPKGGRVIGDEAAIAAARRAAQPSARMIAERVEVADLIANPERRALEQDLQRPVAHSLIGNVPDAVFAHGFSRKGAAPSASSRFEGKAVTFMPVHKIN